MKILIVIPSIGSVYGGPSKSVVELAEATASQGISVDLVTTNANGKQTLDVTCGSWLKNHSYRLQYFPAWFKGDLIFSWSLILWLIKSIKNYDLVHTNYVFSPLVTITHFIAGHKKVPYVATPHGMLEPWALAHKKTKKKIFLNLLEKAKLNQASGIQTLNSSEAQNIAKLRLNAPSFVAPNGIFAPDFNSVPQADLFLQTFPATQNRKLILFLGRIDPKKGLNLLAPAFAQIHQQFPESHLVIAGPDNIGYLPTAKKMFQEAGCQNAVSFTGMLTGKLKYSAIAAASVYVAPSYSEGFSISILEAMASGLPCVFTDACNFPEASAVAKIIPVDQQKLANALTWCLANLEEAQHMGQQARQFIFEHYTWDQIATQMITVYQWILGQGPKPDCVITD
ncbi:glycosyltransferase [Synechocystis sp. PCC 7338]|uniref:glycosyltransferase n=1 Tax=Synechocystis sp. PCC 7338 TaxID=2732530 RepID=UPI001BED6DBE|nr:glycosyltransferase [Synechocystis sp. PCC 7338]QUS59993.1 glycosyltransferase [Synechocystis sp. PCC 7338]